jgi:hypothetical protein
VEPAISVSISAAPSALGSKQTATLTAVVLNDSRAAGVSFSLSQGSAGTLTQVDSTHANYTSGTVTQAATVTVTATSVTDTTKSASVSIAVSPTLAVNVTPASSDLGAGGSVALAASVANDTTGAGVSWSLSPAVGTLSGQTTSGVTYTAPATVSQATTVTVTATAVADAKTNSTATISLHPVSLSLSPPAAATVEPLQTSRITAQEQWDSQGVTWSVSGGGLITALDGGCASGASCCPGGTCQAIYTAPDTVAANATATVTVTSVSAPSQSQQVTVSLQAPATPAWEDLVAFDNGRALGALKPFADLERGAKSGIYQPDRMIFHEVSPGTGGQPLATEIWQLDNTAPPPSTNSSGAPGWGVAGTLNRSPWNANGSYFELGGNPCTLETYCADPATGNGGDSHNYLLQGDGSSLQQVMPTDPDPARSVALQAVLSSGKYLAWDRFNPNLFYVVSYDDTNYTDGAVHSNVYSVDISKNFQMTKIVSLPVPTTAAPTVGVDPVTNIPLRRQIQSYVSENDLLMVEDVNPPTNASGTPDYIPVIYMVDVNPNHGTYGTIVYSYPINFNVVGPTCPALPGLGCVSYPVSDDFHFHDLYFQRDAGDHFIFNFGPLGDVGESLFWQASADGKTLNVMYPDPLGTPFLGHPAWNFDGTQVAYGGYDTVANSGSNTGSGNWIRSTGPDTRLTDGAVVGNASTLGVGHQGWDGYDPHFIVFDGYSTAAPHQVGPAGDAMWSEMSADPTSMSGTFRVLVNDGMRNVEEVANGTEPGILFGPTQSPDGTKMIFAKAWSLTTATPTDDFLAVDHRPLPPTLSATSSGGTVTLTITPNAVHSHREVAGYHVYRSTDAKTFSEVRAAGNTAAYHSFPADPVNPATFTDSPAAGSTYYYAVTAQEFSGLESDQLSNIVSAASDGTVNNAFAATGTKGWATTPPQPPAGLQACRMATPSGSLGVEWKLTWTASPSTSLRYYNIYYSGGGIPNIQAGDWVTLQHYLIDSPAATETSYIYWQANPSDVPAFGILAVDRQDQASTPVYLQTSLNPPACQ